MQIQYILVFYGMSSYLFNIFRHGKMRLKEKKYIIHNSENVFVRCIAYICIDFGSSMPFVSLLLRVAHIFHSVQQPALIRHIDQNKCD